MVVVIAIGDITKPTSEVKTTAMEGEMKVHADTPIAVFSFAAMEKTFGDHITNASTVKFDPVLQDVLFLDLLNNAKLFPYDPTTIHRCIVRNSTSVYGWCEERRDSSWTRTHLVFYQPVLPAEQVIQAVANDAIKSSIKKTWVMAQLTPDTQASYVVGHMSLGDVWVPGLAGAAARIPCDEGVTDRICARELSLAGQNLGISSMVYEQVFVVRSQKTNIAVVLLPQADTEIYASATVVRYLYKVLLTPRFSLSTPACVTDPSTASCFVVSFRRSSQENHIYLGDWRLAYWLQVTFFVAMVHMLTIGQQLGPALRFIIILRLPIFNILAAQTVLLAVQEFKVLMILRYGSGWRKDLVHRVLVLTYAYVVICCHAILSSREYSVSKAQYMMLGAAVVSCGVVIGVTRWLSLATSAPNVIQSCYYCQNRSSCASSSCCTPSYLLWEIGTVTVIYFLWVTAAVAPRVMQNLRLRRTSNRQTLVAPSGSPRPMDAAEFHNNFERKCLNREIIAEYRSHKVYRMLGEKCATTDVGLALTGYCATRDHLLRIDGVTFSSLVLLLPKWFVKFVPVTVTAWPLQRLQLTSSVQDPSSANENAVMRRRGTSEDGASAFVCEVSPPHVETMLVRGSRRVHISRIILQWGQQERVYM